MQKERAAAIRFTILQPLYWASMASFYSFVSTFALKVKCYSGSSVSLLIALTMTFAFLGQFLWNSVCDMMKTNKKIYILCCLISLLSCGIIYFAPSIAIFAIGYALLGFTLIPAGTILDSWMLKSLHYDNAVYSSARGIGSAGFAVVVALMGTAIGRFGYQIMLPVCGILTAAELIISSCSPDSPAAEMGASSASIDVKSILKLTKNRSFMFMLLILFLQGMATAPVTNLKPLLLDKVGGGDSFWVGIDNGIANGVQFIVFLIAGRFAHLNVEKRLYFFLSLPILMFIIDLAAVNPIMIVIGSSIQYGCYGFQLPAIRQIVSEKVDKSLHTTANGIADAVYNYLTGMLSLMYAGSIIEHAGSSTMLYVSIGFTTVQIVLIGMHFAKLLKKA